MPFIIFVTAHFLDPTLTQPLVMATANKNIYNLPQKSLTNPGHPCNWPQAPYKWQLNKHLKFECINYQDIFSMKTCWKLLLSGENDVFWAVLSFSCTHTMWIVMPDKICSCNDLFWVDNSKNYKIPVCALILKVGQLVGHPVTHLGGI